MSDSDMLFLDMIVAALIHCLTSLAMTMVFFA